jgi:hypothetical protein
MMKLHGLQGLIAGESVDPPPQTLRTHSDGEDVMVQLTLHSSHGEHILDILRLDSNLY